MQIVIDIPEEYYNVIKAIPDRECVVDTLIIKYGTPLPKGHGTLKDTDKIISEICGSSCGCHLEECGHDSPCYPVAMISSASTIIEADKAESEDK